MVLMQFFSFVYVQFILSLLLSFIQFTLFSWFYFISLRFSPYGYYFFWNFFKFSWTYMSVIWNFLHPRIFFSWKHFFILFDFRSYGKFCGCKLKLSTITTILFAHCSNTCWCGFSFEPLHMHVLNSTNDVEVNRKASPIVDLGNDINDYHSYCVW